MNLTPVDECRCAGDGDKQFWCECHQVWKTPHWHQLCQTKPKYRKAWNEGKGPGQIQGEVSEPAQGPGWGDKVAAALTAIGVTEDNYKAVKQMFGLPPRCNCAGRKEWLNKVGRYLMGETHGN